MEANDKFLNQSMLFRANVRAISEEVGYTARGSDQVKLPSSLEIESALRNRNFDISHCLDENGHLTPFGKLLLDYYEHRARVLNTHVEPRLMNVERARQVYKELYQKLNPNCPLPMNKQKGNKRAPAYFTCIINMLIEANAQGLTCDYDPRRLITVTRDDKPLRTLARRVDGAFTSIVDPIAVWEIKEYYYTTTFGSRVADGIYETLLDGMELQELWEHEKIKVKHY